MFFIVFLFYSLSLQAQTYSLVIGINNGNLIGAENDARAMATMLQKKEIDITHKLIGSMATKSNILNAFKKIVNKAKENDWVYLFFSGHGRSPFDPAIANNKSLQKQLRGTGALITADNKMLIIRNSLAPLFRTLDRRNVHTIVIFDACFSGMAYKELFNQEQNFAFYTKTPTQKIAFPYKNLRFFSSSTYSDFSSENQKTRRGYFSQAITFCMARNRTNSSIKACLNRIKNNRKLPQQPIILPHKDFSVFPNYSKEIEIRPTYFSLKESLFNLANASEDFQLYAQNSQGLTSKNYAIGEKFSIHLASKKSGYFVLFKMGESNILQLSYPNAQKMPYISVNTNKKILLLTATEPTGEELMGAFLVNKSSALELQNLYKQTDGNLSKVDDIKKAISIIERSQIAGSKLLWITHEK